MKKAVFALSNSAEQTQRIIERLLSAGFENSDISVLSSDKETQRTDDNNFLPNRNTHKGNLTTEKHTKAPEGGVTGATAGGILGGSLGLLAGIGSLAIPGIGPFIAAGPILAALSGSALGGGLGLIIGTLVGSGIPEYEAKRYEAGLKAGNILISVHAENDQDLTRATEILKKEGAQDISTNREKTQSRN